MTRHYQNETRTPADLQKKFGARVRYFRLKAGFSQEELADLCDLDRTYIGGIERGERNPSLKNIGLIAAALNVSLSDLFDGIGEAKLVKLARGDALRRWAG